MIIDDLCSLLDQTVHLNKESEPTLMESADSLHPTEFYIGAENTITMNTMINANFICSFNGVQKFPFNSQVCIFKMFVSGTDNMVTQLRMEDILDVGPSTVGQYVVLGWTMTEGNVTKQSTGLTVSVKLGSNLVSVFLVTYLPTILMNFINQATNYLETENKCDLVITVNVTCMMVLASVYLSVSTSLPSTPAIKPVEVWLLFNLAYPFLVIITNILLEVSLGSGRAPS